MSEVSYTTQFWPRHLKLINNWYIDINPITWFQTHVHHKIFSLTNEKLFPNLWSPDRVYQKISSSLRLLVL